MGVIYEFNWFLVAEDKMSFYSIEGTTEYILRKKQKRIYPVGFSIPLIIKNTGCIGEAKIIKTEIEEEQTTIHFLIEKPYDVNDSIAQYHYRKYLDFKNQTV